MNTRYLTVAALAFGLGAGSGALWHRQPTTPPAQSAAADDAWCDSAHRIPYIDAEHCGGMTSCDRAGFVHMAHPYDPIQPVPCPKE
jgi:hypothetical protein